VQLNQTSRVQHTTRARLLRRPQHVGRVSPNRPRRTIRQLHHEQQYAVPSLERLRREQPPEQRMRPGDDSDLTRQNRTKMLQSVALTSGVGKSHVAQALAHLAIRAGAEARFTKTSRALAELAGGTWTRRLRELARPAVLVLDDFAMRELTPAQADDLYELINERANRSLILTSNRSPVDWYPLFPNPVVAESLLDRLINNSHQLFMNGASYRPHKRPGRIVSPETTTTS
jgi:hypothetical protein